MGGIEVEKKYKKSYVDLISYIYIKSENNDGVILCFGDSGGFFF